MTDYSVKRNYFDQVIVWPDGVEPEGFQKQGRDRSGKPKTWWYSQTGKGYRRTSGIGKILDTGEGLAEWKACMTAVGVLTHDASQSAITDLINEFDGDPYYRGAGDSSSSGKSRLKRHVDDAAKFAGSSSASAKGTEFHRLAELHNRGVSPRIIRDVMREPFEVYKSAIEGLEFLSQEVLIINDELECAGSIDYLVRLPRCVTPDGVVHDSLVVASDLKTGLWDARYPMGVTTQVAGYGTGVRYDQETNTRSVLHPEVSQDWGLLIHFPLAQEGAVPGFYWLDLRLGVEAARLSFAVADMRNRFKRKSAGLVVAEIEGVSGE